MGYVMLRASEKRLLQILTLCKGLRMDGNSISESLNSFSLKGKLAIMIIYCMIRRKISDHK